MLVINVVNFIWTLLSDFGGMDVQIRTTYIGWA
jgi:hypothetical protein